MDSTVSISGVLLTNNLGAALTSTGVPVDEVGKSDSPSDERRPQPEPVFKNLKLVFWEQGTERTREDGMAYEDGTVVYMDGDQKCLFKDGYVYHNGDLLFWSEGKWCTLRESRIYKFEDLSDEWRWQGDFFAMFNGDVSRIDPSDKARIDRFSKHPAARKALMENGVRARPRAKRTGLCLVPYNCGPKLHRRCLPACPRECGRRCVESDDEEFVEDEMYLDTSSGTDDEQPLEPPAKKRRAAQDGLFSMWSFCRCHSCVERDVVGTEYETNDDLDPDEDRNGNELEKPFGPDDPALPNIRGWKPKEGEDYSCPPKEPWEPHSTEDMELNECQDSCQVCTKYLGLGFDETKASRAYISIRRLVRGYRAPSGATGWVPVDPATIECFRVDPRTKKYEKVTGAIKKGQNPKKFRFVYHFIGGIPLPVCNECLPRLIDAKDCPTCMKVGIPDNLIKGYPVKCPPKEINLESY